MTNQTIDFLGTPPDTREQWTQKKENFCQEYMRNGGNASDAYRFAYNCENMANETIWGNASDLKRSSMVSVRLEELEADARKRNEVTIDSLTEDLRTNMELAREEGQPAAANGAVMGIAKLHGLANDKMHVVQTGNVNHNHTVEFVDPADGTPEDT